MLLFLGLEDIQGGKKISEVTWIESELDSMDVDNKRIERSQQLLFLRRVRESLIVIDSMRVLVDQGSFDEGLYDLLAFEDLGHSTDFEGVGHVVVAAELDHDHAFVGRESIVGRVLDYRVLVEVEAQEVELGNLLQGDTLLKLE